MCASSWMRAHITYGGAPHEGETRHPTVSLCQQLLSHVHRRPQKDATRAPTQRGLAEPLSERELEVLHLVAQGLTNQEIAAKLFVSVGTAKKHIEHIHGKLGVSSRTQAVARARVLDLV
jgi:ATP/maltotriose-dependent transcriptional regulator MalT